MFIIFLKFSHNRENASEYMPSHKAWLKRGFDNGYFLLVGSLVDQQGGCILAHNIESSALHELVKQDPFVEEGVVVAEIHQLSPTMTNTALQFLVD